MHTRAEEKNHRFFFQKEGNYPDLELEVSPHDRLEVRKIRKHHVSK